MTFKRIERVTFGAAASLMATLMIASVSLLFSVPGTAAEATAQPPAVTAPGAAQPATAPGSLNG